MELKPCPLQKCRVCDSSSVGIPFLDWARSTFTDWDKLQDGEIICDACLFWFEEQSEELARIVGKDKPQRMRNYSHFIKDDVWTPLSKADKKRMKEILLTPPFPELAVIAQSGQKHIAFRAPRNEPNRRCGWVQFEEQSFYLDPAMLIAYLNTIEDLYSVFSKSEIASGDYKAYRVRAFGLARWNELESIVRRYRGSVLFELALFLAQRKDQDDTRSRKTDRPIMVSVERNTD